MKNNTAKILIMFLILTLFTGCSELDAQIPTQEETETYISNKYGDENIIKSFEYFEREGYKGNKYIVESSLGFEYSVEAGIIFLKTNGNLVSNNIQYYQDTFFKELINDTKVHVDSIFNKYSDISTTYNFSCNYNNCLNFNIEYNKKENIKIIRDFLYDIKNLFNINFAVKYMDDINVNIINKSTNKTRKIKFSDLDKQSREDYLYVLERTLNN